MPRRTRLEPPPRRRATATSSNETNVLDLLMEGPCGFDTILFPSIGSGKMGFNFRNDGRKSNNNADAATTSDSNSRHKSNRENNNNLSASMKTVGTSNADARQVQSSHQQLHRISPTAADQPNSIDEGDNDDDRTHVVALHDAFLDSLLAESKQIQEGQRRTNNSPASCDYNSANETDSLVSGTSYGGSGAYINSSMSTCSTVDSGWTLTNASIGNSSTTPPLQADCAAASAVAPSVTPPSSAAAVASRKRRRHAMNKQLLSKVPMKISPSNVSATSIVTNNTTTTSSVGVGGYNDGHSNVLVPPALHRPDTVLLSCDDVPPPVDFVHPDCKMQKDKGKGEAIGSSICAKNAGACLVKLRAKMRLLTEHCVDPTMSAASGMSSIAGSTIHTGSAAATMKRKDAIVYKEYDDYTETRSLLTLRMGFLSMTYGILLRWDNTKRIILVVLRKNCHDTFYKKKMINPYGSRHRPTPNRETGSAACSISSGISMPSVTPLPFDDMNNLSATGAAALLLEDTRRLLKPPFLVHRPAVFTPTVVSVAVMYAAGLQKRAHWTVQLQLADVTTNVALSHDVVSSLMLPKHVDSSTLVYKKKYPATGDACNNDDPLEGLVLEIKLLEHRLRRKNQRVLRCSMRVPISSLDSQPSSLSAAKVVPTSMRIPCPDGAMIQIEASVTSDCAIWRTKEVEARSIANRTIHGPPVCSTSRLSSTSGGRNKKMYHDNTDKTEDDVPSSWDWLCMVC